MQSTALLRGKHVAPSGLGCSSLIKTECPILFSAPPPATFYYARPPLGED